LKARVWDQESHLDTEARLPIIVLFMEVGSILV